MDCDVGYCGSFVVPAAYASVSEPGGIVHIVSADGTPWHPAASDIARLGVRIETSPADVFRALLPDRLGSAETASGEVFSRVHCLNLACVVEATFVPTNRIAQVSTGGVILARMDLYGQTDAGLAAAMHAVRFQWDFHGSSGSMLLDQLPKGPEMGDTVKGPDPSGQATVRAR